MVSGRASAVLYRLDDRPPFFRCVLIGMQHVLASCVGIIAPPMIIAGAAGLATADTAFIISMGLIVSGIATFIQVKKLGPVGSGLLSVQGTSFSFVPVFIAATRAGGLPLALGTALVTAPVEAIISRFVFLFRRLFPPVVSGIVVLLIGLTLIKVGMVSVAGGYGADDFGSVENVCLGLGVMLIIVCLSALQLPLVRSTAVILGIVAGYGIAAALGKVDLAPIADAAVWQMPHPLKYGLTFKFDYILPFALIYIVTTIETIGDLTATSGCSGEPVDGPVYERRLQGGVLGDSVNSMLAAVFNTPPNTTFSQNNGVIQLTGVAARKVGFFVAGILVLLGLFPKVAALIVTIPQPVIGGATLVLFGIIASAGIRIIASREITFRTLLIMGTSLGMGLGVTFVPEVLDQMPDIVKNLFSSGIATGGLTAMILNLFLPAHLSGQPESRCEGA